MAHPEVLNLSPAGEKPAQSHWLALLKNGLGLALLAAIFLLPRSLSLGSFVTADEPTWGNRSASFYYALKTHNYPATYLTGHPGVTTMWAGAIAYQLKFPNYQEVGQLEPGDTRLLDLFLQHGPTPISLMATARLVVALVMTVCTLAAFLFAWRLFGSGLALFSFLLIAFEPLYVAHSRVLHTNGMLAAFMFLSVMAYLYYLRTRAILGLAVSGAAAGLAFLCISPGIVLVPAIGVIALGGLWNEQSRRFDLSIKSLLRKVALPLVAWGVLALLVIYLVWPAMWSNPLGTLARMMQYGMSAAEGEIGGAHFVGAYQDSELGSHYLYFYPLTYLWRSTPVVLAGIVLATLLLVTRRPVFSQGVRRGLFGLIVFTLVYGVVMTLGAKKYDRYLLPVYLPLDVLAAAGWLGAAGWLAGRYPKINKAYLQFGAAAALLALQVLFTAQNAPYYFTYFNPLMGGLRKAPQVVTVGWGEGLSEAALYLQSQPGACGKKILSWYPLAYNWYSISFGCDAQMVEFTPKMTLQDYLNFDYLVIYINQIQRNQPPELLAYLKTLQPDHSVWIKGVEYVRIYRLHPNGQGNGDPPGSARLAASQ